MVFLQIQKPIKFIYYPGYFQTMIVNTKYLMERQVLLLIHLELYIIGRAALNPDTNRMYLTSYKKLNVVDLNTNTLITSIDFDDKVVGAYVNPKTNKIYVNLYGGEYDPDTKYGLLHKGIAIIDGNNNQIIKTLLVDELYPFGTLIKFDNISNLVYVGRFNTNTLHVFDSITDTLLRTENLPFIYTD